MTLWIHKCPPLFRHTLRASACASNGRRFPLAIYGRATKYKTLANAPHGTGIKPRKQKQLNKQSISLALFADFAPREGEDGKPEKVTPPLGHIPPVALQVEEETLLLTSTEAVEVAQSLLMAAHKVQAEAMLAGFFSTLVDSYGRAVFPTKNVMTAYSKWLHEIDTAAVPVVEGDVSQVEEYQHQGSAVARDKVIRKLMKNETAIAPVAVSKEEAEEG